ncbi:RagB/SusD family nutrient uptake outer membrane protein [Sphingobacterium sp. lm-10]|uniref:RagB/SusD family nutrient uptake outer membrane protein n=1 Tax=Sphingobacterium sp. lm-10 TaxID=2944904 RepID=UPI00202137CB|nr:RagB/SusD family nutrient uptake outer membrane protein [Sphingobacterium sp. lm-10]MCL7987969.1 RagB/SusD family nutrient uptake outer membrane protein [Sphingobacterium sp. lm-10]
MLDIRETDFIGGDNALRTVANNESLLMTAYSVLPNMPIFFNGELSDELKQGSFYAAQSTHEWLFASDDIRIRDEFTAITPYYQSIDRVNRVLSALPNAVAEGQNDEALRAKLRGEALFLRAYTHFELFRFYCKNYDPNGLAMPYSEVSTLENQARIDMGEYFSKISRDLTEAKSLLANSNSDVFRTNGIAVSGLQARVALYTRNWNEAVTFSTEYISALPLATKTEFGDIWTDANTTEVAWKLHRTTANRIGNYYRGLFTRPGGVLTAPNGVSWIPTDKLWNSFDAANDIRFAQYFIDEPVLAAAQLPSKIVNKYRGSGYATNNENVAHVKVFRTAEMYLIRAEARAELNVINGGNSAQEDLNALRSARINNYANVSLASKEEAISVIIQERYKELAFEGHRFWDLKRRNLPVSRIASDAPNPGAATLQAGNFRFVLPIPRTEIQANPLMVQNDGYND